MKTIKDRMLEISEDKNFFIKFYYSSGDDDEKKINLSRKAFEETGEAGIMFFGFFSEAFRKIAIASDFGREEGSIQLSNISPESASVKDILMFYVFFAFHEVKLGFPYKISWGGEEQLSLFYVPDKKSPEYKEYFFPNNQPMC